MTHDERHAECRLRPVNVLRVEARGGGRRRCRTSTAARPRVGAHGLEAVGRTGVHVELGGNARGRAGAARTSMFSSRNTSSAPTPIHAGGSPARSSARAAAAYAGTSSVPGSWPRYARQPSTLAFVVQMTVSSVLERRGHAVVDHRVDEQLVRERVLAAVACQQRERGGEPTAGARARDRDASGIDAEVDGVLRRSTRARRSSRRAAPGRGARARAGTRPTRRRHRARRTTGRAGGPRRGRCRTCTRRRGSTGSPGRPSPATPEPLGRRV